MINSLKVGRPEYWQLNSVLAERCSLKSPLVAVHRGSSGGSIVENTGKAVAFAQAEGADIVEIDVMRSVDGSFHVFHNGYERLYFGMRRDIRTLTAAELDNLQYDDFYASAAGKYGVEKLSSLLSGYPDVILNIDRSWPYWDTLLGFLDKYPSPGRFLLKAPAREELLTQLRDHEVNYPFIPIVHTPDELDVVLNYSGINVVGVELIAENSSDALASRDVVKRIRDDNLLVYLNALNLPSRVPLFLGWDDEVSVFSGPEHGWGRLIEHGADIIQTDWPMLLNRYIEDRRS